MNTGTDDVTVLPRVVDYVLRHSREHPGRTALIGPDDERVSYVELAELVRRHARALWATGVRPGDRVALMAAPRPEFVVSYLATTAIGAIWLGLNPRYSARELAYVLADAAPVLVLTTLPATEREALDEAAEGLIARPIADIGSAERLRAFDEESLTGTGDEIAVEAAEASKLVDTQDPAIIVYTSGSTGTPKGALIRHSGLVRLGVVEGETWKLREPVVLCNLPINHIGCVGDLVGVPLVTGATLVLRESFDAAEVIRDVEELRISALFQIPTQLQRISAHPDFRTRDLSSLELVGWGGSPLPRASLQAYRARGVRLVSTYGLTEATSSVTYSDPDASDDDLLTTVGRPDPGMDVRLLGEDGGWTEGEGEVCVRNRTVMAGYLNRPEATDEAFTAGGWLRTGDVGRLREDGNLVLVGRTKDMYKSGGYNIYPREIEQVLEDLKDVELAAVVARPDPDFHEVGVAYVQVAEGSALDDEALRSWCRERLANFKVPKEFVVLDELPLLPVGKVDKNALRARHHSTGKTHV
ncbi:acyl--CoA ligase [Aeromicrobium sp. YIM 150415]|uniref:class I adenylate-forming enzyme family protein n=1 Tax=Aeromicrobium sp. YIM 150415 TaxID=2803912 RepID=UPI001963E18E|nr:class I adenylate-forming enzyme family protein [Aeromicrobium sp. YIM 150415]MBM9465419.1 acyl--CoA ligase [Aeromicrobium sp. YIM 150415]